MKDIADAAHQMTNELTKQTNPVKEFLSHILTEENAYKLIGIIIMLSIFYGIYKLLRRLIKTIPESKLKKSNSVLILRVLHYILYISSIMYVLSVFGVKFTAIWGAAGVAGVAIGFAAQTSVSNIISGLFVLSEKSLKVGDFIALGDIKGTVDFINLLSVHIHTPDNQMIRIPNSSIINSNLINFSYHDTRRITIDLDVDYNTDLEKASKTLLSAAAKCPLVLQDPAPKAWTAGFADSGISMTLAAWCKKEDFIDARTQVIHALNAELNEAHIVIPYNRVNVCMVEDAQAQAVAKGQLK